MFGLGSWPPGVIRGRGRHSTWKPRDVASGPGLPPPLTGAPPSISYELLGFLVRVHVPCYVLELVIFHVYVVDLFNGSQSTLVYFQVFDWAQRRT